MNLPDADWNTYNGCSTISDEFTELTFNLNLTQLVTGPTHRAGNTLDIALTNFDGLCHADTYTNLPANLSSDHHMITFTIEHTTKKHSYSIPSATRLDYNHANWENMNQFLYEYDFTLALSSNNTEFIWSYIKTAINSSIDLFIPTVPMKDTNQPKWFNSTTHHKIKCLHTLKRKHNRHPTNNTMLKVTNLQEELQSTIAEAKSEYESNLALTYAHTNNNKIFQYISSIKGHDCHLSLMFYNDKQAGSTDSEKALLFNNYFYSVFSSSA